MPDQREYFEEEEEMLRALVNAHMVQMHTALVCIVQEDSDGHTVKLQPAIKAIKTNIQDGTTEQVSLPILQDVPVKFPGGGGVTFTHPVKKGDEVLAIFTAHPHDAWHQSGGQQAPIDGRHHSLSDAICIPGIRSIPRKLNPAPSTTSSQMRSDDGKHYVDLHPSDGITLQTSKNIAMNQDEAHTITVKHTLVKVSGGRVDLGGLDGSPVMTEAGPSSIVFAKV